MVKLNEKRIDEIAENAKASVEMEGLNPSDEAQEISKKFLRGEISDKEAKKQILKLHGISV